MKEQLKEAIMQTIASWDEPDIYVVSLYVYDYDDDPCRPTVTVGYNTESYMNEELEYASDEDEARWNYAFWLQNDDFIFGMDDTADTVRQWIINSNFAYCQVCDTTPIEYESEITEAFVEILVDIVRELHESGFIQETFGHEIPVIIHELEYYYEIAEQNICANGIELVEDFARFCGYYD